MLALIAAKCFHELGHALLAKRYGVRIPRMGIAFLVMFPVLYTDTNESWFITDNRKRLLVSAGGIIAEGALAAVSLFFWGLTADGPVREAFYFIAVASLFRSLLVNSSPFLRFDGYYLLSDYLDLPNLHQRAFALTRHYIRRLIFGPGDPPPEVFPTRRTMFLVAYSLATWLYRLVVFLGIAFAVYRFFFKPLGILLMMVEIWFFILLPVVREVIVWRKELAHLSGKRRYVLALSGLLVIMLLCIPFRTTVRMPAYLTAGEKRQIFAPFSARLEQAVKGGVVVRKGDLLFKLTADEAVYQAAMADRQASELHDRIRRFSLSDGGRDQVAAWSAEARERELASAAQRAELRRLSVRADFDGVILDVDDGIVPGVSVSQNELLGILVNPSSSVIEAVASEDELSRVRIGGKAVFMPSAPDGRPVDGVVVALDQNRIGELPTPALADRHGGEIATRHDSERRLTPAASLYRVRIRPVGAVAATRLQVGYALVEAERRSVAGRFFRQAVSVLIRESGF
jgi:putative peptide zinc metalloprotease protein